MGWINQCYSQLTLFLKSKWGKQTKSDTLLNAMIVAFNDKQFKRPGLVWQEFIALSLNLQGSWTHTVHMAWPSQYLLLSCSSQGIFYVLYFFIISRPKTESSTTKRVRPLFFLMTREVNGRTSSKCLHGLGFLREMAWTGL